jgi:gamma-glutamyltranspeptidase/glutathione hydrolase
MYRAIRLAAGARIANNNPPAERLAELMSAASVDALRVRLRDGKPVEGPTEQWLRPSGTPAAGRHTTSLSVADRHGNVVCVTQSLGAKFGCGVVVPGFGVCLNNFLYWGEVDLRGTNPLKPGAPLALPTAPSIATRDGKPVLSLGTPGSYGICQTQPQALVQHVDFGLGMQDAIDAPRARLWDGRRVQVESRVAAEVIAALRARGHAVEATTAWTTSVGGMHGIAINPATGVMTGGCDPRRDGFVAAA